MTDPVDDASKKSATETDGPSGDGKAGPAGRGAKSSSPSARLKKQAPARTRAAAAKKKTPPKAKTAGPDMPRHGKDKPQPPRAAQKAADDAEDAAPEPKDARPEAPDTVADAEPKPKSGTDRRPARSSSKAKRKAKTAKKPARESAGARPAKPPDVKPDDGAKPDKPPAKRRARLSFKPKQVPIVAAERGIPEDEIEDVRTPVPDLVEVTGNSIPPGCIPSVIETPGGLRLRAAMWPLPHGRAKGTICLFHGRTESIEKYFETVRDLLARGFWVATLDWRGQGGSDRLLADPLKGHVNGFKGYSEDLNLFMHDVVLPDCPPPYFAMAHSMGGLVLLQTAGFRGNWFERIVALAPLVGLPEDDRLSPLAIPAARTMRMLGLGRSGIPVREFDALSAFSNNPLTSDAQRYSRWQDILDAEPRLRVGRPTFGWLAAVGDAMDVVNSEQFPSKVQVPVLMVSAGLDRVISSRAVEILGKRLRIGGHISVDGARHEILQERDQIRDQFFAAFDTFIPGTPSGV